MEDFFMRITPEEKLKYSKMHVEESWTRSYKSINLQMKKSDLLFALSVIDKQ